MHTTAAISLVQLPFLSPLLDMLQKAKASECGSILKNNNDQLLTLLLVFLAMDYRSQVAIKKVS